MRYYPDFVPPFANEPLAENFAIRPIDGNVGEGVVALTDFAPGQLVFVFTGFFISEITLFTLQVRPGLYIHDPFFMGKVLHRCDPTPIRIHATRSNRFFAGLFSPAQRLL